MNIQFLGARANTPAHSAHYTQRTLIILSTSQATIWLDCANSWKDTISSITPQPDAICITHAHEDHVGGLINGSPAPVYASESTWNIINSYDIPQEQRHVIQEQKPIHIKDMTITPYNVFHSIHAPAHGYKVETKACTIFYSSDIAALDNAEATFKGVDIYIGDGSIVERTMLLRTQDGQPSGHAPIIHQIQWCSEHKVQYAIFTHCGASIINRGYEESRQRIAHLGKEHNVYATIAYDNFATSCQDIMHNNR